MKLVAAHIDAFRSIIGRTLELSHECLGLVGINESGKSNVLAALSVLAEDTPLKGSDAPKMNRKLDPAIRFEFVLDASEKQTVRDQLMRWQELSNASDLACDVEQCRLTYHVCFDSKRNQELRFFTVDGAEIDERFLVRKFGEETRGRLIEMPGGVQKLDDVVLCTIEIIQSNKMTSIKLSEILEIESAIEDIRGKIAQLIESAIRAADDEHDGLETEAEDDEEQEDDNEEEEIDEESHKDDDSGNEIDSDPPINEPHREISEDDLQRHLPASKLTEYLQLQRRLQSLELSKFGATGDLEHAYNVPALIASNRADIERLCRRLEGYNSRRDANELAISELSSLKTLTAEQKKQLVYERKQFANRSRLIENAQRELNRTRLELAALETPLTDWFTTSKADLNLQLGDALDSHFGSQLPRVVMWTHSDRYMLQGETDFGTMTTVEHLDELSRPLLNLFRIGLNLDTLEGIKETIGEIQSDGGQRTRYQTQINRRLKDYLKQVWPTYDQQLHISLEQERIRVQFFDPSCDDASYFNMQERSQGCQTFISFLLTIGAEAKTGVISNSLLLLDEPEIHLHPSGVRYMLKELIEASRHSNTVVFATHSVFMIDTENYDRHVIVKKEQELTVIQPSRRDRIGFFMQEEVLYSALDVHPTRDFGLRQQFNFVFEGDGDATLFESYFTRGLRVETRPFELNKTSFYQGGKCGDILKYFKRTPIQLGATWIFLLDRDMPADELRTFLVNRFQPFVDQFVFVYQYSEADRTDITTTELEDMLPIPFLSRSIVSASEATGVSVPEDDRRDGESFDAEMIRKIIDADDRKRFETSFKSHLNRNLRDACKGLRKHEDFIASFPKYTAWADRVVGDIAAKRNGATSKPKTSTQ
ncbi:AAA family ATPase [Lacipirellula parvula]|uniref:Endonuclease GajA/Old nuclease/RecF-like AAA domain-containing protein n=1 Tax=Lacipirellula parvula TaxID=2650471 RepID=A0A5K7XHE5_9BACT|nr:AAA family ATPase [Lacipirellula parvula]BBO32379.1 hypothetical protein PLANPX_1991 [Lacipirellula parvula]